MNSAQFRQVLQEPPCTPEFPGTRLAIPGIAYRSARVCSTAEHCVPRGGPGSPLPLRFQKQGLLTNLDALAGNSQA